jgi:hypothetical protein
MNDKIETWTQGCFVDQPQYRTWSEEAKSEAKRQAEFLVRSGPTDNAICRAYSPEAAQWIAQRLNRAAKLEAENKWLQRAWEAMQSAKSCAVTREEEMFVELMNLSADRKKLLQLLESASEVIGRFVSDEGWKQSDMDMMDHIAAEIARRR